MALKLLPNDRDAAYLLLDIVPSFEQRHSLIERFLGISGYIDAGQRRWLFVVALLVSIAFLGGCPINNDGSGGNGSQSAAVIPTITSQPEDQSITAGQSASFAVVASGTGPISYQWQRNDVSISGATNSTYSLSSATVADSGAKFTVIVGDSAGSVTSNAATLTVTPSTQTPQAISAAIGGRVSSEDGQVTLTIPPNGLTADGTVSVTPTADWTVPAALASQFTAISGATYTISSTGGSFNPSQSLGVSLSTGALAAAASRSKVITQIAAVRRFSAGVTGGSSQSVGLVIDCGNDKPTIIILPPDNGYGTGTSIVACPSQVVTISFTNWNPPSPAPVSTGNVIWDSLALFKPDTSANVLVCPSCGSYTRGDTWLGSTTASIAASSIPEYTTAPTLITLVDGNGNLTAQQLLPVWMTDVKLDGPANFYVMLGRNQLTYYVARYALEFSVQGPPAFVKLWEKTLTGVQATDDGNTEETVVGNVFAVDPVTGDLIGLAGNASSSGALTTEDVTRLGFKADGFVVRLDRDGTLVSATPVVSTQALSYANEPLDPTRFLGYALRVDHAGNTYVATTLCCKASNTYGLTGLTLKKINRAGALVWETAVAGPGEIGSPIDDGIASYYDGYSASLAIDGSNNVYLIYYRYGDPANPGSHLFTVKLAPDTGAVSPVGYLPDQDTYALAYAYRGLASYIDDNGTLYVIFDFMGTPAIPRLVMLSPSLAVEAVGVLPEDLRLGGGFQVDDAGNVYEQQTTWTAQPSFTPEFKKIHF